MSKNLLPFLAIRCPPPAGRARAFSTARILGTLALGLGLVFGPEHATAQLKPWTTSNGVYLDLTVLDGSTTPYRGTRTFTPPFNHPGSLPGASSLSPPNPLGLLEPPSRHPTSRLLITHPPAVGMRSTNRLLPLVKLRNPGTAAKKTQRTRRHTTTQQIRNPPSRPKVIARKAKPPAPRSTRPARSLTPSPPKAASRLASVPPLVTAKSAPPKKPGIALPPKPAAAAPSSPSQQRHVSLPNLASKPAARPAPKPAAAPGSSSVAFAAGEANLSTAGKKQLDGLAARLEKQANIRMQLLAYASGENLSASKARRLSLSRALAIRSYLISKGVRSTRIDVRALGNKVPVGRPDRVDLKIIQR